jgi:hypothetical protein
VVNSQLACSRRELRVEIREALAMRAHAAAQISIWIPAEALRHRQVSLGFSGVSLAERHEMRTEARMIGGVSALDELPNFDGVQQSRRFVLRCGTGRHNESGEHSQRY